MTMKVQETVSLHREMLEMTLDSVKEDLSLGLLCFCLLLQE